MDQDLRDSKPNIRNRVVHCLQERWYNQGFLLIRGAKFHNRIQGHQATDPKVVALFISLVSLQDLWYVVLLHPFSPELLANFFALSDAHHSYCGSRVEQVGHEYTLEVLNEDCLSEFQSEVAY